MDTKQSRVDGALVVDGDSEINLAVYLLAIWRGRYPIVGATVLCAVAALIISSVMPRTYEAMSRVIVIAPKSGGGTTIAQAISEMGRDHVPNVATYRELANNQSLAAQIVSEFKLGDPPFSLTPSGFLLKCVSFEALKDTDLIEIKVRLAPPDLAARVANRLADESVELAAAMSEREAASVKDVIKVQLDESRIRLEQASAKLQAFRATGQTRSAAKGAAETADAPRGGGQLADVQTEFEVARSAYVEAATRYDQARVQVTTHSASLQVVDRAVAPGSPISPRPLAVTAVTTVIAFGLAVFAVLFVDYIRRINGARADRDRNQNVGV